MSTEKKAVLFLYLKCYKAAVGKRFLRLTTIYRKGAMRMLIYYSNNNLVTGIHHQLFLLPTAVLLKVTAYCVIWIKVGYRSALSPAA